MNAADIDNAARPRFRIGELSRRTGVPVPTLRAWERRYGFPMPSRTDSGYRLYTEADVAAVGRVVSLLESGLAISQAIEVFGADDVTEPDAVPTVDGADGSGARRDAFVAGLVDAFQAFDSARAHDAIDAALAAFSTEAFVCDVALPAIRVIGDRYVDGVASIANEHFGSDIVRGRLWNLARGWDRGIGPRVQLALAAGEQHDLPMLALGLLLRERGWRVTWLGANTPASEVVRAARATASTLVVLGCIVVEPPDEDVEQLARLAGEGTRLAVVGEAATAALAQRIGASRIEGGVRAIADELVRTTARA